MKLVNFFRSVGVVASAPVLPMTSSSVIINPLPEILLIISCIVRILWTLHSLMALLLASEAQSLSQDTFLLFHALHGVAVISHVIAGLHGSAISISLAHASLLLVVIVVSVLSVVAISAISEVILTAITEVSSLLPTKSAVTGINGMLILSSGWARLFHWFVSRLHHAHHRIGVIIASGRSSRLIGSIPLIFKRSRSAPEAFSLTASSAIRS